MCERNRERLRKDAKDSRGDAKDSRDQCVGDAARKASWKNMGVEPGNQEGPGCQDLGRVLVLIKNTRFVRDNRTNQTKEGYRGQNPVSKKLLVRSTCERRREGLGKDAKDSRGDARDQCVGNVNV